MAMNPNFSKEITRTPNPEETDGLSYCKSFIDYNGNFYMKKWVKQFKNNKLRYSFDAVWKMDGN